MGLDFTRSKLEQWVETRRTLSKEKEDWRIGRELLNGRIEDIVDVNVDIITVRAVHGNDVLADVVSRMLSLDGRLLVFGTASPRLAGMELEIEAPLVEADDRLFVMKRST